MSAQDPANEPRRLTAPVLLAVLALPLPFAFLLLRPGYSRDLRTGAFLYAFLFPALQLTALILGADGTS
jgi:hypothetical protein